MNATQYARWVKRLIGDVTDRNLICKILKDNGFRFFFSGFYKKAYRHPNHPQFLTKVYRDDVDSEEDSQYVPKEIEPFYLQPILLTEDYMVQPFANGKGGNPSKAFAWFKNHHPELMTSAFSYYDMKPSNVRFHDNRAVIIDFVS